MPHAIKAKPKCPVLSSIWDRPPGDLEASEDRASLLKEFGTETNSSHQASEHRHTAAEPILAIW